MCMEHHGGHGSTAGPSHVTYVGVERRDVLHAAGSPSEVAYQVSQRLIRERLREVETIFAEVKKKREIRSVWSIGIQLGAMLVMDAIKDGRLEIKGE